MTKQLMQSYNDTKAANPDAIVAIRCGDFYEFFGDDAKTAARLLGLAITLRNNFPSPLKATAMVGFPYHCLDIYVAKLVASGHRLVIAEPKD